MRKTKERILQYIIDHPVPAPTVREIAQAVGLSSSSTVHSHLTHLRAAGKITWNPACPRTIRAIK